MKNALSAPNASKRQNGLPGNIIDTPLVHTLYESYTYWHKLLLKFPKSQRYTIGQECSKYLLATLEYILQAATTGDTTHKKQLVAKASTKLDTLKLLVRLCKDCECITNRQYQEVESKLYQAGKMIGGWIKSIH